MESVKYLLGNFGDNSWIIWEGLRLKYGGFDSSFFGIYGFNNNQTILEPLTYIPFLFLSKFINSIDLWNFYVIILMILNLYFGFRYFNSIKKNTFLALLFSIIWISNSYFSIHSRDHLSLLAGFLFPIFLLIKKIETWKNFFIKYIFLFLSILTSTYIGIFLLFANCFWSIYYYYKNRSLIYKIDSITSLFVIIFLSGTVQYFFPGTERNIDNFLIFSAKPWHFFIQSERSLINLTDLEKYFIGNNIFLNYFDNEHSVSYFGLSLIFLFLVFILTKKIKLNINLIFLFFLIFISLPPFITIKGINFYLPSYIFYELFPQLRVLSRINVFSFIIFLGIIYSALNFDKERKKINYIILALLIFSVIELQVPYKITLFENNKTYEYLKLNTLKESQVILYPYDITDTGLKTMIYHQRKVINPKDYEVNDFNSKDFTKNLSCEKIIKFNIDTNNLYLITSLNETPIDSYLNPILEDKNYRLFKVSCK